MRQKKTFSDPAIGTFTVTKNSQARRIRLSIAASGVPNVTIPRIASYKQGIAFAQANLDWIQRHSTPQVDISIGESYVLYDDTIVNTVVTTSKNSLRRRGPGHIVMRLNETDGTNYFLKKINQFLVTDTLNAVNARIEKYAPVLDVQPSAVVSRATKSRWGSCSRKGRLMFSAYVAQLPNELIDYIVIHELAHLVHMDHSSEFWALVARADPDYKAHRRELKKAPLEAEIKPL